MKQRCSVVFLVLFTFTIFSGIAHAENYRLTFTVNTTNYTDINNRQVNADIILGDTKYRPPNAIKSLSVTAPNGKVFTYNPTNPDACKHLYWDETIDEFWFSAWATDFGGAIPSGKYTVKVTDLSGFTLTHFEDITIKFLPCPTITYPGAGETVASLTPKITWSAVTGAKLYRVYLRYGDNTPIYPFGTHV